MAIGKKNGGNGRGGGLPKKPNGKDPTMRELVETLVVDVRSIKSDVGNLKKGMSHLRRRIDDIDERLGTVEIAVELRAKE